MPNLSRLFAPLALLLTTQGWAEMPKPLAFPQAAPEVLELCEQVSSSLSSDIKELEAKLGKSDKVETVNLPNRHDPEMKDIRRMYLYGDGLVSIYSVPKLKADYLEAAVFTKDFWPKKIPMYLGLNTKELAERLGPADEQDEERIVYVCSHETGDSINFLLNEKHRIYRMVLRNAIE